jgi:putative flavoprotein involved in K+ transport
MPFPAPSHHFPTKDEMADYLEAYARRFGLPVRTGVRVESLSRPNGRFLLDCGAEQIEAENVVVAMSSWQTPRAPDYAGQLDPSITQLHSAEYVDPSQLREGGVLVVGAGNSGAEIALDVAGRHHTWLAGRDTGHVPFRIDSWFARVFLLRLLFFAFHHLFTVNTPIGRTMRAKAAAMGMGLVRQKPAYLTAAGIERVPRVAGVSDGQPLLADGRTLDVANVIWSTGYHAGLSWIELPVFQDGDPVHDRGVTREPGLYFVGQRFLYAVSSAMIRGAGRDAEWVVRHIVRHRPPPARVAALPPRRARSSRAAIERALMLGLGLTL